METHPADSQVHAGQDPCRFCCSWLSHGVALAERQGPESVHRAFKELYFDERNLELAGVDHIMVSALSPEIWHSAVQFGNPCGAVRLAQEKLPARERYDHVVMFVNMPTGIVTLRGKAPFGRAGSFILYEYRAGGRSFARI